MPNEELKKLTDTPRTDAEAYDTGLRITPGDKEPDFVVQASFARTLERECAALQQKVETLRRERVLAVAHDRQPYPTADAYEAACAALHKCKERLAKVRNEALQEAIDRFVLRNRVSFTIDEIAHELRALKQHTGEDGETP